MDLNEFLKPADAFEVVPACTGDPRTILYKRWMDGENVLEPLIQAHLMVPKDKAVVPEILRLCAQADKNVNNLFRLTVAIGDRADDHARALVFGRRFLELYPKKDKPRQMMEKMMDYWNRTPTDPDSKWFRLSHGDYDLMVEHALAQEDPWLKMMWLMHAAAGGNAEAWQQLARLVMEQGDPKLAIRLMRHVSGSKEFIQQELEVLVFEYGAYQLAEQLAFSLEDDSVSRWLRVIHYGQGKNHNLTGIEEDVKRLPNRLSSDRIS